VTHRPLYNTVNSPSPRYGGQSGSGAWLSQANSTALLAIVDQHPNVKVIVTGHSHSVPDAPNFTMLLTLPSGRQVWHVNTSSTWYVSGAARRFEAADPLRGFYLTMVDDDGLQWEYRVRNHGTSAWTGFGNAADDSDAHRVKTLSLGA
jgi:hypothetical protein